MQRFHGKYAGRDDFKFITVATDGPETLPKLQQLLSDKQVEFPVLHELDAASNNSFGWNAPFRPWSYLIDPQGNIVNQFYGISEIEPVLDYFLAMDGTYPPYGINANIVENQDGSFQLRVHVTSPSHETVSVNIYAEAGFGIYGEKIDGEWQWLDSIPEGKEANGTDDIPFEGFEDLVVDFEFGEFGEATKVFELANPLGDKLSKIFYYASYDLPGIDVLYFGEALSIDDQGPHVIEK